MKALKYIFPLALLYILATGCTKKEVKITILHTNDTHSQVEPINDRGGYARRLGMIEQIRKEEKNVLLLDAGDFWQGTSYFNYFRGKIEIDAMNRMKYDAVTLGNHEFDKGLDSLFASLQDAKFPVISSNYTFPTHIPPACINQYIILEKAGIHIGIMALGIQPEGLILKKNYIGTVYTDPMVKAIEISELLKEQKKCDLVICLSHLGANEGKSGINDFDIARGTKYIDVIISGHSHQIIENTTEKNLVGKKVIIAQMGKKGQYLGRIDLQMKKK